MNFICIIAFLLFGFCNIFGQSKAQNYLMVNDLIIGERIPIDTSHYTMKTPGLYAKFQNQKFLQIEKNPNINFGKVFMKKMADPKFRTLDPWATNDDFPYSLEKNKVDEKNAYFERLGGGTDTMHVYDNDGNMTLSAVERKIDTSQISGILFYDKWMLDEKNFALYKDVVAYCPIRKYYRPDDIEMEDPLYKKVTMLYPEDKLKKNAFSKLKPFLKISFEFYLGNENLYITNENNYFYNENDLYNFVERDESPFWNSYNKKRFINLILDRALNSKTEVYDFFSKEKLKKEDILARFGCGHQTIQIVDENGETKSVDIDTEINQDEIKSVIFIEEWYLDPNTLKIYKKVVGVAPVRTFFKDDDVDQNFPQKNIAFLLYFDSKK